MIQRGLSSALRPRLVSSGCLKNNVQKASMMRQMWNFCVSPSSSNSISYLGASIISSKWTEPWGKEKKSNIIDRSRSMGVKDVVKPTPATYLSITMASTINYVFRPRSTLNIYDLIGWLTLRRREKEKVKMNLLSKSVTETYALDGGIWRPPRDWDIPCCSGKGRRTTESHVTDSIRCRLISRGQLGSRLDRWSKSGYVLSAWGRWCAPASLSAFLWANPQGRCNTLAPSRRFD